MERGREGEGRGREGERERGREGEREREGGREGERERGREGERERERERGRGVYLQTTVAVHKQVAWLDVPVDDSRGVEVFQAYKTSSNL